MNQLWEHNKHTESTEGVFRLVWETWTLGPYKVITTENNDRYMAYYYDQIVSSPPDWVECHGCADSKCTGYHKAWKTLDTAKQACEDHLARAREEEYSAELPW
jgi:hypothetical protein